MVPKEGKAANPFHSLAVLQKLAHHASFRTAPAVAFPRERDLHSIVLGRIQPSIGFSAPFLNHTRIGLLSAQLSVSI
jgi:hypothetical protein